MPISKSLPAELIVLLREVDTADRQSLEKLYAAPKTRGTPSNGIL
jgi:hypothetical protein